MHDTRSQSNSKTLPMLVGDKRRLTQVLINLIKNSLKFTFEGQIRVVVDYFEEKKKLYVSIQDTGLGIDEKDQKSLFQDFRKLESTEGVNNEGIGLGLSICKSIVE